MTNEEHETGTQLVLAQYAVETPKELAASQLLGPKGLDAVGRMDSIQNIGLGWHKALFRPVDFWKNYAAGEFNK